VGKLCSREQNVQYRLHSTHITTATQRSTQFTRPIQTTRQYGWFKNSTDNQDSIQSIDQILSFVGGIKLIEPSSPPQADNNDLKELEHFTRKGLLYKLKDLNGDIGNILKFCSDTMQELNEGTRQSHQTCQLKHTRWQIISLTTTTTKSINQLIKWIDIHGFISIQEDWAEELSAQEHLIAEVTEHIYQTINYSLSKDDEGELSEKFEPLEENMIPLAQSLIPILKLS
jgi:hypothetical protein